MGRPSRLKPKFGITAQRMAVRAHVPWYWRALILASFCLIVIGVAWAMYQYGMELAGFRQSESVRELSQLREELRQRESELAELKHEIATSERERQIDRATYGDLERQVKALSLENAALREDLEFFQSLMAADSKAAALTVNRFRVRPAAVPGEYRYRLLLVQTGQRIAEFKGKLQFVLNLEQGDRKYVLMLPSENEKNARDYELRFKFFQRIQGTFKVSPEAIVKSMQVRVFEKGATQPKLTQTVTVS